MSKYEPDENEVVDKYGHEVPWYHDDYEYYKYEMERYNNPLDDDYCKYNHD